jgi:hypothetical protein
MIMQQRFFSAALIFLCAAPLARATEFAVLLGNRASDAATVGFDAKVPNLTITGMTVSFDPADLPADATLIIDTDPVLPDGVKPLLNAFTFSLSLEDNATQQFIHEFTQPVSVNIAVASEPKISDFGLSRLLETTTPPTWIIQDANLTAKDGPYVCGTTDHFSYFALTPLASVPEPAMASLLLVAIPAMLRRRSSISSPRRVV